MEKINVRGVEFDNVTFDEAVELIYSRAGRGEQTAVFTPNAEIVQACVEDESFRDIITSADVLLPDGVGVIKAARILGTPLKEKVPGVEVGEALVRLSGERDLPVFLMGGKPGVADEAKEKLLEKYPGAQIAGSYHGYFKKEGEENDEVVKMINDSGAGALFVCIGSPAQEKWIAANRGKLPGVKVLMGLGGSLDIYSGTAKRAPKIFIKLGMEWFYRLLKEPKRIGRMMKLPKFYVGTRRYKRKLKKEQKKQK